MTPTLSLSVQPRLAARTAFAALALCFAAGVAFGVAPAARRADDEALLNERVPVSPIPEKGGVVVQEAGAAPAPAAAKPAPADAPLLDAAVEPGIAAPKPAAVPAVAPPAVEPPMDIVPPPRPPAVPVPPLPAPAPTAGPPSAVAPPLDESVVESRTPPARPAPSPAQDVNAIVRNEMEEARRERMGAAATVPDRPARAPAAEDAGQPLLVPGGVDADVDVILKAEELRRQAFRKHARAKLAEGEDWMKKKKFAAAAKALQEAKDAFGEAGERPEDEADRMRVESGLTESLYRHAQFLYGQGALEDARQWARDPRALGHEGAARLIGQIEEEMVRRQKRVEKPPPPPQRWHHEDYQKTQSEIMEMLRAGKERYATGEYDSAQDLFERVLKRDPENTEAIRFMQKLGRVKMDRASMELEATRKDMVAEVRKTWNPRDYGIYEEAGEAPGPEKKPKEELEKSEHAKIVAKMKSIKIPQVSFRQAYIQDVVAFLQEASVEHDKTGDERKGVNIVLNTGVPGPPAGESAPAPADADPFKPAAPAAPAAEGAGGEVQRVSFNARYISLYEALDIVTKVANLKWYIVGSVVMVVPFDKALQPIIVRMYDVLSTIEERMKAVGDVVGASRRGGDITTLDGRPLTTQDVDWKATFGDMGVPWPQGSSIKYVRPMSKLVVANTAENLEVFEQVLSELNVVPMQIEIEARFVEVSQTDLDGLGFEWMLTDDWEIARKEGGGPLGGQQRIVMPENASAKGFTKINRFLRDAQSDIAVPDDLFSIATVLTNPELTMVLHAIHQRGNADLLSAPKVTTQSGSEATIKVVTEYIYPTEFEVMGIGGAVGVGGVGGAGGAGVADVGAVVQPGGFETREVGVILSVLPEVNPESQMITLTMNPEVVSEPTWKNYGSVYTTYDANGNPHEQRLNMEQPFFHTRSISTTINIYNGSTVVMGGMIAEVRHDIDDKIPWLGDIPVLGRLFRSTYERSEKRNLLIFVTARLVDPGGRLLGRKTTPVASAAPAKK